MMGAPLHVGIQVNGIEFEYSEVCVYVWVEIALPQLIDLLQQKGL